MFENASHVKIFEQNFFELVMSSSQTDFLLPWFKFIKFF